MIKIPITDIISKIQAKTNLSEQEINVKIDKKLDQLSGLISREGAAHIIANELGIKLFEQTTGKLQIKNVLAGMRNVETLGKVQRLFELREFQTENRSGKVASLVAADETGSIRIVLWGDQADKIKQIKEKDIIKIIGPAPIASTVLCMIPMTWGSNDIIASTTGARGLVSGLA